jgi:hypothetical protein
VAAVLAGLAVACSTTLPVAVPPKLEPPEEPVKSQVAKVTVAVLRYQEPAPPPPPPPPPVKPRRGHGPVAREVPPPAASVDGGAASQPVDGGPPPLPATRVEFTNTYAETYPSLAHALATLPPALKEQGFDVLLPATLEEARASGAALVLEVLPPEVEGFRAASGLGLKLEGGNLDVHVHYRALLSTPDGRRLGMVSGHGESDTHFLFVDQHVETMVVGLISLATTALVTVAVALPAVGIMYAVATQSGSMCREARLAAQRNAPAGEAAPALENCPGLVNVTSLLGLMAASVGAGWLAMGFSHTAGAWVFGLVTGGIKRLVSGPRWEASLKSAHDRATRSLAAAAAQASGRAALLPPAPPVSRPGG